MSDKHIAQVQLLLHCDGTDGGTTFTDSSAAANTVTANGNAQLDTAQSMWGGASALFDGNGDYLSIPDSAALELGNGDFTIEMWVRFAVNPAGNGYRFMTKFNPTGNQRSWAVFKSTANEIAWFHTTAGTAVFTVVAGAWSPVPVADRWYHLAWARSGTTLRIFVDGKQMASGSVGTETVFNGTAPIEVGRINESPQNYHNGWIDDLRITVGRARYTANFVRPQGPFNDRKDLGVARVIKPPMLMVR